MKILLINPSYHKIYAKVASAEGLIPPLGLAYIAAYLRHHGHKVRIIDWNIEQIPLERLAENLPDGFQVVGTTSFTPTINDSIEVLRLAKKRFLGIKTIMGGVHITVAGKETMERFPEIDFGIVGEGEETVLELINNLENSGDLFSIKGLIFRKNKQVIQNEKRPLIRNLDSLPFPAHDLLPMDKYRIPTNHVAFGRKVPMGPFSLIFTSRGCPRDCTFCASKILWGRKVRFRSAEDVLEEIEILYKEFGVRVINIADDIFTLNKGRLHKILDGIITKKLKIHFTCLSRVDTVAMEDLEKLKKVGCYLIRYGVESGAKEILDLMRKGITPEQVIKTFEMTNKVGIASSASFIIGHPGETKKTVKETIELAKKLNATVYLFNIAVPYLGTELYEIAKREKLFCEDMNWEDWIQFPDRGVLRTKELSREDINHFRKMACKNVYFHPKFLWKSLKRIKTWDQVRMYVKGAIAVLTLIRERQHNWISDNKNI